MSGAELFVIFLVAFLVFGPNKLPMLAEHLAKLLQYLSRLKQQLTQIWQDQIARQQLNENTRRAEQADKLYLQKADPKTTKEP